MTLQHFIRFRLQPCKRGFLLPLFRTFVLFQVLNRVKKESAYGKEDKSAGDCLFFITFASTNSKL
jgi:hypothetical protein